MHARALMPQPEQATLLHVCSMCILDVFLVSVAKRTPSSPYSMMKRIKEKFQKTIGLGVEPRIFS